MTLFSDRAIARVTPAGVVTRFPLPGVDGSPAGITAGPDGALWFVGGGVQPHRTRGHGRRHHRVPGAQRAGRCLRHRERSGRRALDRQPGLEQHRASHRRPGPTRRCRCRPRARARSSSTARPRTTTSGSPRTGADAIGRSLATPAGPVAQFPVTRPPEGEVTTRALPTGARATVRCSDACTVSAQLLAPRAVARKLGVAGRGPLVSLGPVSKASPARSRHLGAVSRGVAAQAGRRGPTCSPLRLHDP